MVFSLRFNKEVADIDVEDQRGVKRDAEGSRRITGTDFGSPL